MAARGLVFLFVLLSFFSSFTPKTAWAQSQVNYHKDQIRESRFGDADRQKLLQDVYQLDQAINKNVFGQELATQALRDRMVQYLESYGSRTKEPVALNFMGLPGIGKSAMIDFLNSLGIQTLHFDAQTYSGGREFVSDLWSAFAALKDKKAPTLLIIEELDKVAETNAEPVKENIYGLKTQGLIGALNEILSEGKLSALYGGQRLDLSNTMVLTTMNISPVEITTFSKEALGEEKSFYDFTPDDFAKFHQWVQSDPSAIPKILSRLFRSNTVSRLSPNTVLFKPLTVDDYKKITRKTMDQVIARDTQGTNLGVRLDVTYTDDLADFIADKTTYAPSGARNTLARVDILTDQLIQYAKRATSPGDESLNRPRKVVLGYDKATGKAVIQITPQILDGKQLKDGQTFSVEVDYVPASNSYAQPAVLALTPPPVVNKNPPAPKPLSKAKIRETRFPKRLNLIKNLQQELDSQLFGQGEFTALMAQEMNNYLARPDDSGQNPSAIIFAGFPGIGKSEIVNLTAKYLDLPVIRVNLQQYSSNESKAAEDLIFDISDQIEKLKGKKYILLLEELDKVFEIDPNKGTVVNRPVMALIKDILNDGKTRISYESWGGNTKEKVLDVSNAFVAVTMNFAVDRFHFEADPRMTTIEDVYAAWQRLSTRLTDLKGLLRTIFLPETVNRLLSRIHVMKPLDKKDYQDLIDKEVADTLQNRFFDKDGNDIGQIELNVTPRYKDYLFSESVIPSEGARHTVNTVSQLVNDDLELMVKKIPRNAQFSGERLIFTLDYLPGSQTVKGSIAVAKTPNVVAKDVYERQVSLSFPPLAVRGKMPADRLLTAVHEFGHAFVGLRLGLRFEYVTVVNPKTGIAGYTKWTEVESQSAAALVARLYAAVASRAMERVMMGAGQPDGTSVVHSTPGAASDIEAATKLVFNILYEYGFDPSGGTIERKGIDTNGVRYANFSDLPPETVENLGLVVRKLEDKLVTDLSAAHDKDWYVDKIQTFARAGGMTEPQFYELIEYPYPGDHKENIGENVNVRELFGRQVQPVSKDAVKAETTPTSADGLTPPDRMKAFQDFFVQTVQENLHQDQSPPSNSGPSCDTALANI